MPPRTPASPPQEARGLKLDVELTGADLREVVRRFKAVYERAGKALPADPYEQLSLAINAVFGSWNTPRAVKYRWARACGGGGKGGAAAWVLSE
jgi:pyruvate,orthophosphate dikinase